MKTIILDGALFCKKWENGKKSVRKIRKPLPLL